LKNFFGKLLAAVLAIALIQVPAFAAQEPDKLEELTVDKAVSLALQASPEIRNFGDSKETLEENLDTMYDDYYSSYDYASKLRYINQIMELEASLAKNGENTNVAKDKLKISVINLFSSIISAQRSLEITDDSLALTKKELKIAKLRMELGYMAKSDYDAQVASYDQRVKNRETQEIGIQNAFISLNKTIGRSLDRVYDLQLYTVYEPIQKTSQYHIEFVVANSVELAGIRKDIDVAKMKVERHDSLVSTETKESLEKAVAQLERNLYETERNLNQKALSAYNTIKNQEIQHEVEVMKLDALKSQVAYKEKQLELGRITQLSLDTFMYQFEQQEESIRSIEVSHYINVLTLTTPGTT
jgi:outer membrane protein TolC